MLLSYGADQILLSTLQQCVSGKGTGIQTVACQGIVAGGVACDISVATQVLHMCKILLITIIYVIF